MHLSNFLIAVFALGAMARSSIEDLSVAMRGVKPSRHRAPTPDKKVSTFFPLHRSPGSRSSHFLQSLRQKSSGPALSPAFTRNQGISYYTPMKIGPKTFNLIFDTGSSDTWIPANDFHCFNVSTRAPLPQAACAFTQTYTPGPEFDVIEDVHFNIFYGDGSSFDGIFGKVDVKLTSISLKTTVALVKNAAWTNPDGISNGFLGLAYPDLGAMLRGPDTNLTNDTGANQVIYNPIFTEMWTQNLIPPVFSIALNRASELLHSVLPDGWLAFGGLVPAETHGKWAKAPVQYVVISPVGGFIETSLPWPQYQWYTITPDAFIFSGSQYVHGNPHQWSPIANPVNSSDVQVIIDTGATQIWLPTAMADAVAALYSPPAIYDHTNHLYTVPCNAIPPKFAIQIDGTPFPVDPRDMILDDETGRGTCMSAINDGQIYAPYVIGDVFLKNVVVVFDVGAGELRVRARKPY